MDVCSVCGEELEITDDGFLVCPACGTGQGNLIEN